MNDLYYDPDHITSYGGSVKSLAKSSGKSVKQTAKWLSAEEAYTLHKPARKRYERRRVITGGPGQQSQADLIDVSKLSKHNDNFKFLLTCVDVFSKKAHVVPIKSKSPVEVVKGFTTFEDHLPFSLNTDKGMEFKGKTLQDWLHKRHVKYFTSQDPIVKCSIVERFNRTILSILYRYFTKNNTLRYVDVLPKLVRNYNNRYHSAIDMAPNNVNAKNAHIVWRKLYPSKRYRSYHRNPNFKVGDTVRISKTKKIFDKGYLPQWTGEIFTVRKLLTTFPYTYKISDWSGESIDGSFYEAELQKVTTSHRDVYDIEKVLRSTKNRVFVKWKNWPSKFNSWVSKKDLIALQ